ncbi:low temperature requirement protein A [Micromonospora fluostatini]|uniref:Low temperature requirement protein A n=2 Tax=Micromonospora TaxID=1873 RepID=A0ABY2DL22_9ACTN|nr:low temperature requirement protein A [Micromonospora fluostatini]
MVVGMAALFAFALAVPQAIHAQGEGLAGPITVAVSYLVVRAVHFWIFWHVTHRESAEIRYLNRLVAESVASTGLLLAAAFVPILIADTMISTLVRDGCWAAVVLSQYATGLLLGSRSAGVTSAEHWTERYDLILMIALGESVLSVGLGTATNFPQAVHWPAIAAAGISILLAAALWWWHFDVIGPAARIALHAAKGRRRVTMARDAYAYIFLPMIAGLILFSLGAEEMLKWLTEPHPMPLGTALPGPGVPLLFGGLICYLAGDMLFQLRTLHTVTWLRLGTLLLLAALIPVALRMPALAALVMATVVCVGLAAAEVVTMSEARAELRHAVFTERTAHEAREAQWRSRWHHDDPDTR